MNNDAYDIQTLFEECLADEVKLSPNIQSAVDNVVNLSEKQKGVLTVIVTGLVYKYFHPKQDVRYHQTICSNL